MVEFDGCLEWLFLKHAGTVLRNTLTAAKGFYSYKSLGKQT